MTTITANELKRGGAALLDKTLKKEGEAFISVRGSDRYVIMGLESYNRLRECELSAAVEEARREYEAGKYVEESAEAHVRRVTT